MRHTVFNTYAGDLFVIKQNIIWTNQTMTITERHTHVRIILVDRVYFAMPNHFIIYPHVLKYKISLRLHIYALVLEYTSLVKLEFISK